MGEGMEEGEDSTFMPWDKEGLFLCVGGRTREEEK